MAGEPATAALADLRMAREEDRTAIWTAMASAGPVFQVPGGTWDAVERAVRACPEHAISIEGA